MMNRPVRPMIHYPETGTKNRYQKTRTGFFHGVEQCSNSYQILVPEKIGIELHLQETGTGFLIPVIGTGFWIVSHGP